ncbi:hypothetical protein EVAR_97942_1 [Eumeta japonica]|uniref:Uncharacterized protein n=1 Tax=Eumeta variegata TaxID=151549 RepID=A0A4C1XXE0_EUMVA|nr:hypothetical protein EVAR_97942_1 [Eumeta japonica]
METIDRLQNKIQECISYKKLHDYELLTSNIPLIDDEFEKKFCDFIHQVFTGFGKSYNALCRSVHIFNEVVGSLIIAKRKKGRQRRRWEDDIKSITGFTRRRKAHDRTLWRAFGEAYTGK